MFEALKALDSIRLNFSENGLFVLNISIAFIMFGVALGIKLEHFTNLARNKRVPAIGLISQYFLLPFFTFILVVFLNKFITPTIAMGMILVASCPGGNISNFLSALSRGNAALAVSLTAIGTVFAVVFTPLSFYIWGSLYTNYVSLIDSGSLLRPLEISPVKMFETVILILGIPICLGMAFNHYYPKSTKKIIKPIKTVSLIFFILFIVFAFQNNYYYFIHYIKYIFIIVLIHNGFSLLIGYFFSRSLKCSEIDCRTISIETGIHNSGLALVLLFNPKIFPPSMAIGGMMFVAAWWGLWHIISGLMLAGFWSQRIPKN
jgi:bile acid:Na+ symporter, BASS family